MCGDFLDLTKTLSNDPRSFLRICATRLRFPGLEIMPRLLYVFDVGCLR